MRKLYINGETYFYLLDFLTKENSEVWANNLLCIGLVLKLLKGFEKNTKKINELKEKSHNEMRDLKKRERILKKINELGQGFFISVTEKEKSIIEKINYIYLQSKKYSDDFLLQE